MIHSQVQALKPLGSCKFAEQEELIISDLLNVLIGIEGVYIRYAPAEDDAKQTLQFTSFELDATLDSSLADIVMRILPTAAQYMALCIFLDEHGKFEYGKVNHALTAAIRTLLKDYLVLISQLDEAKLELTIQKLWYYLHAVSTTMSQLARLAQDLSRADSVARKPSWSHRNSSDERLKALMSQVHGRGPHFTETVLKNGGAVLELLWERLLTQSGDPASYRLFAHLLCKAAVPYFDMLKTLLTIGLVNDPYHEFMVVEKRVSLAAGNKKSELESPKEWYSAEQLWETRWSLRTDEKSIPMFLDPYKEKILATSKYLNLVKECSSRVDFLREAQQSSVNTVDTKDIFQLDASGSRLQFHSRWQEVINSAYRNANVRLLAVLREEHSLLQHLLSLKRFFLLNGAPFLPDFFEAGMDELHKSCPEDNAPLQSLLDLIVRNPTSLIPHEDLLKDKVQLCFARERIGDTLLKICGVSASLDGQHASHQAQPALSQRLHAWEALTLNVEAEFPVSLVINSKSLSKYQLLFRHLFKLLFLDYNLATSWKLCRSKTRHCELATLRTCLPRRPSVNGTSRNVAPAQALSPVEQELLVERFAVCSKLTLFMRQLLYYHFSQVIEPNWRKFELAFAEVKTVDELLTSHTDLLDTCLKEGMLTSPKLLKEQLTLTDCVERYLAIDAQLQRAESFTVETALGQIQDLKAVNASFSSHASSLVNALSYYATIDGSKLYNFGVQLDSFNFGKF